MMKIKKAHPGEAPGRLRGRFDGASQPIMPVQSHRNGTRRVFTERHVYLGDAEGRVQADQDTLCHLFTRSREEGCDRKWTQINGFRQIGKDLFTRACICSGGAVIVSRTESAMGP